jgi:hypothetical protein
VSRIPIVVMMVLALAFGGATLAQAASNPNRGQPSQSCEEQPSRPGNASSAPGSAFNPDGHAGTVYAGTQPQNSNNPKSVSQYDVACYQVSQH